MNPTEIEFAVKALVAKPYDPTTFPFDLIGVYNARRSPSPNSRADRRTRLLPKAMSFGRSTYSSDPWKRMTT